MIEVIIILAITAAVMFAVSRMGQSRKGSSGGAGVDRDQVQK